MNTGSTCRAVPCAFLILLLIAAGCVAGEQQSAAGTGTGTAVQAGIPGGGQSSAHKLTEPVVLTNGSCTFTASVDKFATSSQGAGGHTVDVYIRAADSGSRPVTLRWYSMLTTTGGKSYGGIGVSHGGNGAVTRLLEAGYSETPRDYVVIDSDRAFTSLSDGGILSVTFFCNAGDAAGDQLLQAHWALLPGSIQ